MKRDERARQTLLEAEMAALFAARTKFLILDTETTGLLKDPDAEIIEISVINQEGEVVFSSLVRPEKPVPAAASKVHGLTDADLGNAPTFPEIHPALFEALAAVDLVFCYNTDFDLGMLRRTTKRYGLAVPSRPLWLCMQQRYAEYAGSWSDYHQSYTFQSLSRACAALRVPMSEAHRATGDAQSTLALMKALAARGVAAPQSAFQVSETAWPKHTAKSAFSVLSEEQAKQSEIGEAFALPQEGDDHPF